MDNFVVMAAGGSGTRIGGAVPKQFTEINGWPLIRHTIHCFQCSSVQIHTYIISCHPDWISYVASFFPKWFPGQPFIVTPGGDTRFHSVQNALNHIHAYQGIVAIHDAARPFVEPLQIETAFELAARHGSYIPFTKIKDSLRIIENRHLVPIDREKIVAIQTPQVFNLNYLKEAYKQPYIPAFTDDASVFEHARYPLFFAEGADNNFKITTPADLALAGLLLPVRVKDD